MTVTDNECACDSIDYSTLYRLAQAAGVTGNLSGMRRRMKDMYGIEWVPQDESKLLLRCRHCSAALDPESGLPHAWHYACSTLFVAWFMMNG